MTFEVAKRARRARLIGAGVCLLLALSATGCGAVAPPPEPVTISFAFPEADLTVFEKLADLDLHADE